MKQYLTFEEMVFINQYVQKIHSLETMEEWFNLKDIEYKREIVLNILNIVIQSHPTYEEIQVAANELKLFHAPVTIKMLNRRKPFEKYGYEIANLPENELSRSFRLLLRVLSISDTRRKNTQCANGCNHWWHADLSKFNT